MVTAGLLIELLFKALGLVPKAHGSIPTENMQFFAIDSTFYLNLVFILLAGGLVWLANSKPHRQHSHAPSHGH